MICSVILRLKRGGQVGRFFVSFPGLGAKSRFLCSRFGGPGACGSAYVPSTFTVHGRRLFFSLRILLYRVPDEKLFSVFDLGPWFNPESTARSNRQLKKRAPYAAMNTQAVKCRDCCSPPGQMIVCLFYSAREQLFIEE